MDDVPVNYLGKLNELGQKCKFVVDLEVVDAPKTTGPSFKCILRIPNHDILVEQIKPNKKGAKATAAEMAFEKICEKIAETKSTPIDTIAAKLKGIELASDKKISSIEFGKKLATLDISKVDVDNGNSYSELNDLVSAIQCTLAFDHGEITSDEGSVENFFVCHVHPSGALSPTVSGYGWSDSLNEARTQAVNQLLALLKIYSRK